MVQGFMFSPLLMATLGYGQGKICSLLKLKWDKATLQNSFVVITIKDYV
jgi:hypothetical protein